MFEVEIVHKHHFINKLKFYKILYKIEQNNSFDQVMEEIESAFAIKMSVHFDQLRRLESLSSFVSHL